MLTKQQLEYASDRVHQIAKAKIAKIPTVKNDFSMAEILALVKSGKVKPIPRQEQRTHKPWDGVIEISFDFSSQEDKAGKAKYQSAVDQIRAEETRIMDQLVLGDVYEALKMIEEFSKF